MTITRERQPDYSGWEAGWCGDPCFIQEPSRGYGIFIDKMLDAAG